MEHLGPWVGLLAERLANQAQTSLYRFLGNFLHLFLELEDNLHCQAARESTPVAPRPPRLRPGDGALNQETPARRRLKNSWPVRWRPTAISARGRSWGCAWPCWAAAPGFRGSPDLPPTETAHRLRGNGPLHRRRRGFCHQCQAGAAVPQVRGLRHHGRHLRQPGNGPGLPGHLHRGVPGFGRPLCAAENRTNAASNWQAYKVMPDSVMFRVQEVEVDLSPYRPARPDPPQSHLRAVRPGGAG